MTSREFFQGLRNPDRRDLMEILKILRSHKLDVVARGSSAQRGHKKKYNDVDLLVRGDHGEFDTAVRHIESYLFMPWTPVMGAYVDEPGLKTTARYPGFDFSYHPGKRIRDDVPQVDLLINPEYRE